MAASCDPSSTLNLERVNQTDAIPSTPPNAPLPLLAGLGGYALLKRSKQPTPAKA